MCYFKNNYKFENKFIILKYKKMQNDFLSDYQIKETIGKGTFSEVKLGINKITKEKVAIKILKKKKIVNNAEKIRLEREINILKKINHINLIKTHKINEDSDNYYIVMEYCENGELFNYIVDRQKLDEEESSYFFYQLINGLNYIHHKNIVHRDLKPENLLLGKGNILKIVDFGLSNYYEEDNLLSTPCGSPCYASPEMVCGNKYNGLLIDIWSCGIIIFAMTCGFLPFEDANNEILFKKIMKCKIDYPDFLTKNILDIMKRILIVDPNKRITIPEIKKHPFYLKGKSIFESKHKNLVCQVEKVIDDDEENEDKNKKNINNNIIEKIDINIKKSKSTNFLNNENIDINDSDNNNILNNIQDKKKYKLLFDSNIIRKENDNNSATNRDNSNNKENNNYKGVILKKFHISINSKDKDKINKVNKILSKKYEIKDINKENKIEESLSNSIKKISKNVLGLIDKKANNHQDIYNTNIMNDLTIQNPPLSDNSHHHNFSEIGPNIIEGYENMDKKNNIIIPHGKAKVNLNLLQKLLNKEKSIKYHNEKKYLINSPTIKKNKDKDNISYILPPTTKKHNSEEKNLNPNSKTEYKNKIISLNYNKNERNNEEDINPNPSNRSEKPNDKSIMGFNKIKKYENTENIININKINENKLKNENKRHNNLELIKYGISNKNINELFKNNKNIKKIYEPKTTKNKPINNLDNLTNNETSNNYNTGIFQNNVHIKNLRILNNNHYNNIKNITNINNVKCINNNIICNSPLKSLIKDVHLTKINNNNDLPNINFNTHKDIKTLNNNSINNNNFSSINTNQNMNNNISPFNNNVLIPRILVPKEINNNNNNHNTSNPSKIYISSLNKKINNINKNINKKNNVNNLINNYRNSASSIEYSNKKTLSKKQISERNINSYGLDFMNLENENNSINKKNNIIYTTKNNPNLNKIKNTKLDPFTYGRNKENLITLKKLNYHNKNNTNFNSAQNTVTKKALTNNILNQ